MPSRPGGHWPILSRHAALGLGPGLPLRLRDRSDPSVSPGLGHLASSGTDRRRLTPGPRPAAGLHGRRFPAGLSLWPLSAPACAPWWSKRALNTGCRGPALRSRGLAGLLHTWGRWRAGLGRHVAKANRRCGRRPAPLQAAWGDNHGRATTPCVCAGRPGEYSLCGDQPGPGKPVEWGPRASVCPGDGVLGAPGGDGPSEPLKVLSWPV